MLAPVHDTLLMVSVFSVYSYRNYISPHRPHFFAQLSLPEPTCVKTCHVVQEILHIHHSGKHNLLQLKKKIKEYPSSLFGGVKDHADMLLLRKKERKKNTEQ